MICESSWLVSTVSPGILPAADEYLFMRVCVTECHNHINQPHHRGSPCVTSLLHFPMRCIRSCLIKERISTWLRNKYISVRVSLNALGVDLMRAQI